LAPLRDSVIVGTGAVSVIVMLCETDVSAALVAVMVTFGDCGAVCGAVYSPLVEMVPTDPSPPSTPSTLQVTPVFVLPVTVATYCDVSPRVTLVAPLKVSVTVPPDGMGAANVTERLCETDESAWLVAVIVTFGEFDVAGAA
jgi:hypothetical protein